MSEQNLKNVDVAAEIVAAYVSKNEIAAEQLPLLLQKVYSTLQSISEDGEVESEGPQKPAVPIKKSVFEDYIICLENGQKYKSLKRHLKTAYGLSPEQYRVKWGLPSDYPMVAPSYARARSTLAKNIGLGQSRTDRRKADVDA